MLYDTPLSEAISSTVCPNARLRATRASAAVRSNSDCTSSTDGACRVCAGIRMRTPTQCSKRSRADRRIGATWAIRVMRDSEPRTGNDLLDSTPSRWSVSIACRNSASALESFRANRSCARQRTWSFCRSTQFICNENSPAHIKDERRQSKATPMLRSLRGHAQVGASPILGLYGRDEGAAHPAVRPLLLQPDRASAPAQRSEKARRRLAV